MSKLEEALEELTDVLSAHVRNVQDAAGELADAQEALENISGVSAPNAHIAYSCVEYPNATVYLDVVGNVTRVEFDGNGWEAVS